MTNKYPKVFYTSDLHIGHKFVAGTRGFLKEEHKGKEIDFNNKDKLPAGVREWTDPDAHNDWLANIWDNTVREIDIIYLLGDMSMSGGDACLKWLDDRPGKKNLILGNHEPNHPSNHDSEKHAAIWKPHFNDIQTFSRRRLGGSEILMSHFPYSGRGAEGHGVRERHTQYRLKDMGMPLLHGHTHGKEKLHFSDFGTPQIHVGIDSWGRFVEQDEIIEMLHEIYPPIRIRPYTPSPTYTYMRQGNRMQWNELKKMYEPVKDAPKPALVSA